MTDQLGLPGMPDLVLPVHGPPYPEPFEIKGSIEYQVDLTIDLAGLIREYPDEYAAAGMERGHEEYERPMVFLHEYLEEEAGVGIYGFGKHVKDGWDTFEFDVSGKRWSKDQFEALVAACPQARITPEIPGAEPANA
jgi:hypothetical protein